MPFTVPSQPAPFPSNFGGTGQTYYGTDWGRLGGAGQYRPINPPTMNPWDMPRDTPPTETMYEWLPWNAQAPGYTQQLPGSTYAPWWRGAAFGPQGRGRAPTQAPYTAPIPGGAPPRPDTPGGGVDEPPGGGMGTWYPTEPITTYVPLPKPMAPLPEWPTVKNPNPPPPPTEAYPQMAGGSAMAAWPPKTKTYPTPKW